MFDTLVNKYINFGIFTYAYDDIVTKTGLSKYRPHLPLTLV